MVVPPKPTPTIGLEIDTVCCSISGILIDYEVYEGKDAMASKAYVGKLADVGVINKSTALTLRCIMEPNFSFLIGVSTTAHFVACVLVHLCCVGLTVAVRCCRGAPS